MDFFTYIIQERAQIISLLVEHINLTLISVLVAILIGVPMGILISHFKKINKTVRFIEEFSVIELTGEDQKLRWETER